MATISFDDNANHSSEIETLVLEFLSLVQTLEDESDAPIIVFQDGKSEAYYIKCNIKARDAARFCDTKARLNVDAPEAFRANRELLLTNKTFLKMKDDAADGREFNDIIVEYSKTYDPAKPLKVWGGQHRTHAIIAASDVESRFHGFRVYFRLDKTQRTEVALISNTNIDVSNDTFDRMVEETIFGDKLRRWCHHANLIDPGEDFPDVGGKSEIITVKLARTFIVNFHLGKNIGNELASDELDRRTYEPYEALSGINADPEYESIANSTDILGDQKLIEAGMKFAELHFAQRNAVIQSPKITNRKGFRNKALVLSVLFGWSYVAGLLQSHEDRLATHYSIPRTTASIPDPLNAIEMSRFHHNTDAPTYRGLGTRSALKDRQRVAQLFLARSKEGGAIDKSLMRKAVSTVVSLKYAQEGY